MPQKCTGEVELFANDIAKMKCAYARTSKKHTLKQDSYQDRHYLSQCNFFYTQHLEKMNMYSPHQGSVGGGQIPQPQVHIGMSAVPQLNPSTEQTSFVNACVQYEVSCSIQLSGKRETYWTGGDPTVPENSALFAVHSDFYYEQTHEVFGMWGGAGGTIKANHLDAYERLARATNSQRVLSKIKEKRLETDLTKAVKTTHIG